MPTSVPGMPSAGALNASDLLYIIQGLGLDRDRKVTLDTVRSFMHLTDRSVTQVTGTGVVTQDVTGVVTGVFVVWPGVTQLKLGGTFSANASFTIINATGGTLRVAPYDEAVLGDSFWEGSSAGFPFNLLYDGDAAVLVKCGAGATSPWQSYRVPAMKAFNQHVQDALPSETFVTGGASTLQMWFANTGTSGALTVVDSGSFAISKIATKTYTVRASFTSTGAPTSGSSTCAFGILAPSSSLIKEVRDLLHAAGADYPAGVITGALSKNPNNGQFETLSASAWGLYGDHALIFSGDHNWSNGTALGTHQFNCTIIAP